MPRILIVDDERDVVSLLRFLLEKDGHSISEAFNGAEALGKIKDHGTPPPELVLLDVMMPVMDGLELSQKLAADPKTRAIPLIVLSAKMEVREAFRSAPNVASFLDKPFDPKKLREIVNGALGGKP